MAVLPFAPTKSPIRIGFLSPHNPYDRCSFSGTAFFAAKALQGRPELAVRVLGHRPARFSDRLLRRPSPRISVDMLDLSDLDIVLGLVATPLLDDLAQQHPDMPFLHVTDATPAYLRDVYGWKIPFTADAAEARVAEKAAITIYSSEKIARRACRDLDLPALDHAVVPFGVNMDKLPEACPQKAALGELKLLFVGVDWERKGGDIAVAILDELRASGLPAHLTVIGALPDRHRAHPGITHTGFLAKSRRADTERLVAAYEDAHFLLLPSRGDCTPMVVAEAMSFGVPVLSSDVGGLSELVGGPGTGRVLPRYSPPGNWAAEIRGIISDPIAYSMMSDACFDRARSLLNWDQWAGTIADISAMNSALTGVRITSPP